MTAKSIGEHFANELKAKGLDVAQAKTINFETSEFNVKASTDVNVTGGPTGDRAYLTELDTPCSLRVRICSSSTCSAPAPWAARC